MKNFLLKSMSIVFFLLLVGCQLNTITTNNATKGFSEPGSSDWVAYMKPIREYMYYRTQAVINKDIDILWAKYPEIKNDRDFEKGINVEKDELDSLNMGFELIDANYDIEAYEPIKVKTISEEEVVALVHASIVYLSNDFEESGGEYLIEISLVKEEDQWTVVKTDEYTMPEYKEWLEE
ncbi:hypothetical protein [Gracilibacillus xinjiangensis]|uniref:DUF4829 domain-containing protein n=1 Tax=Gracilibacillus xinjiangensis TaxID=1193282 RepID=A0ABV8WWU4_9BACI